MNVSLTPELESLVKEKVSSGRYTSASEVVRDALRLLQERDELKQTRLEELWSEIRKGIEAVDRGELLDGEEIMAGLAKRHEERIEDEATANRTRRA